jgi:hypothetical protein
MRIIMTSFLILGLASRGQIWGFGLRSSHPDFGGFARAVLGPRGKEHLKLGIQKSATLPEAAPTHPLLSKAQSCDTSPQQASLRHFIQHLADSPHAEIGVAFRDLETGKEFFFNERKMMHAPAFLKFFVKGKSGQAEQGKFRLDGSLIVKNQFNSIVDGSSYRLDIGADSDESIYGAIGKKISKHPQAVSSGGTNKWNSGGKNGPPRYRGNFARNLFRPDCVAVSSGSCLKRAFGRQHFHRARQPLSTPTTSHG